VRPQNRTKDSEVVRRDTGPISGNTEALRQKQQKDRDANAME